MPTVDPTLIRPRIGPFTTCEFSRHYDTMREAREALAGLDGVISPAFGVFCCEPATAVVYHPGLFQRGVKPHAYCFIHGRQIADEIADEIAAHLAAAC